MDYLNYADIPFKKIVKLIFDFLNFSKKIDFFWKEATN